jgi:hypothetical protein
MRPVLGKADVVRRRCGSAAQRPADARFDRGALRRDIHDHDGGSPERQPVQPAHLEAGLPAAEPGDAGP